MAANGRLCTLDVTEFCNVYSQLCHQDPLPVQLALLHHAVVEDQIGDWDILYLLVL